MQDKGQDTSSFMVLLWTGWADGKSELCTAHALFVGIFYFFSGVLGTENCVYRYSLLHQFIVYCLGYKVSEGG